MDIDDLNRLREIAAKPEETDHNRSYDPLSDARMAAAAQAVIRHSERFDLDGEPSEGQPGGAGLPAFSYISSLLADILHLADVLTPKVVDTTDDIRRIVSPGGARESLEQAVSFISDSDTPTYDNLKGLRVL